ncbi:LamG-like jellyroll fold domain-containing protein [Azospirillum doebereinerae]|uniref:LamG domain-containing protein n=1 Tax=Azospirillum doebereinerae TaxID=92933 RepID=UPI001EE538CB|nr:LamG domain-containing protein [Azospirillum doebereinerae]MCG5238371.1 LamG domain-containing protein [Azospirillum doebereinerae]
MANVRSWQLDGTWYGLTAADVPAGGHALLPAGQYFETFPQMMVSLGNESARVVSNANLASQRAVSATSAANAAAALVADANAANDLFVGLRDQAQEAAEAAEDAQDDVVTRHADITTKHGQVTAAASQVAQDQQTVTNDKALVHTDRLAADADATATAADRLAVAADKATIQTDKQAVHDDRAAADAAAVQALAAAAGLNLPSVSVGDAGKSLIVNEAGTGYAVGSAASTIQQSGPLYAPSAAGFSLTGKSILAAYEQIAGQTFSFDYNTRASYAEQDGVNGTDATGGAFSLHNTAGAVVDANTGLLIHADGVNGSTEILDERGITPFGTHCAYFDGTAQWKIPKSYKTAFGTTQNFTVEFWLNIQAGAADRFVVDFRDTQADVARQCYVVSSSGALVISSLSTLVSSPSFPTATWVHVAHVRNNGTSTLYVNGVSAGTFADTVNYVASGITLGRTADGNFPMTGWLDQFRVSKVARYTVNFTPPTAEFVTDQHTVHLFQFNDGHGSQFIRDASKSGHQLITSGSLTNTRSKFGTTALSGSLRISGDTSAASERAIADFLIGADNFTVDAWVYPTAWGNAEASLFGFANGSTYSASISVMPASGALKIYLSDNGTSYNLQNGTACGSLSLNTWQHVAWTRSGTSVYVFVNGTVVGTFTVGANAALTFSSPMFLFNRSWGSATAGFVGQSSELRVKRGQALWTSNFTPPVAPATTDANTILLCHFDGSNGDTVTLDSSESSYGVSAYGPTGGSVPSLGFGGATTALSATYTRGGHGTSLLLNGTNAYAAINYSTPSAGHPIYFSASDKLCIEGWFYWTAGNNAVLFNLIGASNSSSSELRLLIISGVPTLYSGGTTVATGPSLSTGWNHVAAVRDGRGWCVYSLGVGGSFANPPLTHTYANETYTLYLGTRDGTSQFLTGAIDSFRITHGKPRYTANFTPGNLTQDDDTALLWVFDGAVGQAWVKELSKNTTMIQSTNARTVKDGAYLVPAGTSYPKITTSTYAFGGGAIDATVGSNGVIRAPHIKMTDCAGDFCLEARIYPKGVHTTFGLRFLTLWDNSAATGYGIEMLLRPDGQIGVNIATNSSGATTTLIGTTIPALNTMHHVALVRYGASVFLFLNGSQIASATVGTIYTGSTAVLTIGNKTDGSSYSPDTQFNGVIDEIRFSRVPRWTVNFTPPTIPYGQQYVTGPFWVATKPGASALDLSAFSSVDSVAFAGATPPSTSIVYLLSTDGYAAPLRRWNGAAWVATAYSMTWSAGTLSTTATAAQLAAVGNTLADLTSGLLALDVSAISSLNVVAVLATGNQQFTPTLDAITLGMDEYQIMQPGTDYTVKRKKANGVQALEFKRLKAGNANHVVDYVG